MPIYQFEALSSAGQPKKGQIDAGSEEEALAKIKSQGLFPTSVRERKVKKKESGATGPDDGGKKKKGGLSSISIGGVSGKLLTQFSRQLSTLQDAGLPILRSLQILAEQQKPGLFKNILTDVASDVEGGSSLSESMAKHPKAFDRLYVKMIAAGEIGGVLDIILQRLAEFLEKAAALRKRIIGAMIYPAAVVGVAVAIVVGIMIFVVPSFEKIFEDFNTELPTITTTLIATANWIGGTGDYDSMPIPGWLWILALPFIFMLVAKMVRKSEAGRAVIDRARLYLPVFGALTKAGSTARFARTLGTLIAAGVPILEAIIITRDTVGNHVFENALQKVHDSIREGESFAAPLRETKVVDLIVVNMIDVGEETGDLDKMLFKIADNYDEEVDNMVKTLMSLLEPFIVVLLGVIVMFIVLALFMPLPTLIEGVM